MSWINIANYLDRFKDFKPSRGLIKEEAAKIVSQSLGFEIKPEDAEFRSGILYLKIKNPSLRTQIFMRKNFVLDSLASRMGRRAPKDVRF